MMMRRYRWTEGREYRRGDFVMHAVTWRPFLTDGITDVPAPGWRPFGR